MKAVLLLDHVVHRLVRFRRCGGRVSEITSQVLRGRESVNLMHFVRFWDFTIAQPKLLCYAEKFTFYIIGKQHPICTLLELTGKDN